MQQLSTVTVFLCTQRPEVCFVHECKPGVHVQGGHLQSSSIGYWHSFRALCFIHMQSSLRALCMIVKSVISGCAVHASKIWAFKRNDKFQGDLELVLNQSRSIDACQWPRSVINCTMTDVEEPRPCLLILPDTQRQSVMKHPNCTWTQT